jgi:hypothetical protein
MTTAAPGGGNHTARQDHRPSARWWDARGKETVTGGGIRGKNRIGGGGGGWRNQGKLAQFCLKWDVATMAGSGWRHCPRDLQLYLYLKMSTQLSARNPFRILHLTLNPTGMSRTSRTFIAHSYHVALPSSHTFLTPTPMGMSTISSAPTYQTVAEPYYHPATPEGLLDLTSSLPSGDPPNRPLTSLSRLSLAPPQFCFLAKI